MTNTSSSVARKSEEDSSPSKPRKKESDKAKPSPDNSKESSMTLGMTSPQRRAKSYIKSASLESSVLRAFGRPMLRKNRSGV
jgi:hypothetical protein